MFSFVRSLFGGAKSDVYDTQLLRELHTGYSVGFGYMPQEDLSGRRFRIGEASSYRFGDDTFVSYALQHASVPAPINMIVELNADDPYIAISQVIDSTDQKQIFGREISTTDSLFLQDKIVLDVPAGHRLSGWTAGTYKKVIDGIEGEFIRGHHQFQSSTSPDPWRFRYYLFVSESNDYGVEIENYDHGICKISLTVFRPVTDIGQVRKPATTTTPTPPAAQKKIRDSIPESIGEEVPLIAHEQPVLKAPVMVLSKSEVIDEEPAEEVFAVAEIITDKEIEVDEPASPAVAPKDITVSGTERFNLPCPASVAGKLIEEARRNQIPLSQLVRKILGLSIHVDETVIIPFDLTRSDILALSEKYGIDGNDPEALRLFLLKEVALFTGEKDEMDEPVRKKELA